MTPAYLPTASIWYAMMDMYLRKRVGVTHNLPAVATLPSLYATYCLNFHSKCTSDFSLGHQGLQDLSGLQALHSHLFAVRARSGFT